MQISSLLLTVGTYLCVMVQDHLIVSAMYFAILNRQPMTVMLLKVLHTMIIGCQEMLLSIAERQLTVLYFK